MCSLVLCERLTSGVTNLVANGRSELRCLSIDDELYPYSNKLRKRIYGPEMDSRRYRAKQSISSIPKRKKSNIIIAISDSKVIISDSAKLFGDLIGKNKDNIKNYLRHPQIINGFHLYYNDFMKRQEVRSNIYKRSYRPKTKIDLYLKKLNLLDEIEYESVETIYSVLRTNIGKIYKLEYDNSSELGYKIIDFRYEYM